MSDERPDNNETMNPWDADLGDPRLDLRIASERLSLVRYVFLVQIEDGIATAGQRASLEYADAVLIGWPENDSREVVDLDERQLAEVKTQMSLMERHIPVIGMSGNPHSLLARYAEVHLNAAVDHEACPLGLAPTSSTTAALALGDALACALMEARHFQASDFAQFHPGGSLGRRLLTKARDVMRTDDLPVVTPEMKLSDALFHMTDGRLGLCVAEEEGRVAGIITDGDVRRAMQTSQDNFFRLTVADIMTRSPKVVSPEEKITEIDRILHQNKIHSVLVVDGENRLLGIVDSFSTMF